MHLASGAFNRRPPKRGMRKGGSYRSLTFEIAVQITEQSLMIGGALHSLKLPLGAVPLGDGAF